MVRLPTHIVKPAGDHTEGSWQLCMEQRVLHCAHRRMPAPRHLCVGRWKGQTVLGRVENAGSGSSDACLHLGSAVTSLHAWTHACTQISVFRAVEEPDRAGSWYIAGSGSTDACLHPDSTVTCSDTCTDTFLHSGVALTTGLQSRIGYTVLAVAAQMPACTQ